MDIRRTKENIRKWGLTANANRECGAVQISSNLLECTMLRVNGERRDFLEKQLKNHAIQISDFRKKLGV